MEYYYDTQKNKYEHYHACITFTLRVWISGLFLVQNVQCVNVKYSVFLLFFNVCITNSTLFLPSNDKQKTKTKTCTRCCCCVEVLLSKAQF
jgi:hypothetical protein